MSSSANRSAAGSAASSVLRLRVRPGARRDAVAWEEGRGWKVSVAAPAVDGKANDRLLSFLARDVLGVPLAAVQVRAGASGREKLLDIGLPPELVEAAMRKAAS